MTTPEPTGPSDPSNASDPGNPLPARIDDARRQDLNEKLTLAVGQGRIDLSEFSTITDAVWSVTDVDRFARLEQLIAGKSATPDDAEIDRLAEKAGPSPESGTDNPPAKKPKGSISSFSAAISNFEATTVVPHDHVPTQSSWFGDIELTSSLRLGERQGYSLVFGSVKLTVPPGVQVVNQMKLPFGDVKVTQREGGPAPNYPDAPTVVLTGRSTFGDLRVRVAEPGEKQSFWSWLTEG